MYTSPPTKEILWFFDKTIPHLIDSVQMKPLVDYGICQPINF